MEVPFETEYNRQDFLYQEISYMQGIYMDFHILNLIGTPGGIFVIHRFLEYSGLQEIIREFSLLLCQQVFPAITFTSL